MAKRIKKATTGNPFTLLAKAFDEGDLNQCLEILTNIYVCLCRKLPSRSLKKSWKLEIGFETSFDLEKNNYGLPLSAIRDFIIKKTPSGCYHIRLYINNLGNKQSDCWLDYSNEANAMSIDGHKSHIAKRGRQLMGY